MRWEPALQCPCPRRPHWTRPLWPPWRTRCWPGQWWIMEGFGGCRGISRCAWGPHPHPPGPPVVRLAPAAPQPPLAPPPAAAPALRSSTQTSSIFITDVAARLPGLAPVGARAPADAYAAWVHAGCDAVGRLPRSRWDDDAVYWAPSVPPPAPGQGPATPCHARFAACVRSGPAGFDAAAFGWGTADAAAADPHGRLLLELCAVSEREGRKAEEGIGLVGRGWQLTVSRPVAHLHPPK